MDYPTLKAGVYRIIGIDPGTETLGVCILDIDMKTGEVISTTAFTLIASKSPYFDKELSLLQDHKTARLKAHLLNLQNLFIKAKPSLVASEAPFYNRMRPSAYAPLVETMMVIREALLAFNRYSRLITLDPPRVKKAVGAKGNAKKEEVEKALRNYQVELKLSKKEIDEMDEHSVDATCVAYAHYLLVKNRLFLK